MNVYCKMSSKAPVIISANVDWIPTGNMENMGVKRGNICLQRVNTLWGRGQTKCQAASTQINEIQFLYSGDVIPSKIQSRVWFLLCYR